jgi:hypothetical protein
MAKEKELGSAKSKEDLDTQAFLDAYAKCPEAFHTYVEIVKSGKQDIIDMLRKGLERLKRGMDSDEDPEITRTDLAKMLDDFRAKRKEASDDA